MPKHSPYTRQGYIHSPPEHSAKREHAAHCHHKPTGPRLSCHHLFPPGLASGALPSFVHGAGARGSIDWKDVDSLQKVKVKFDAFVRGGAAEAEELFMNEGKPVHCLSTRFEGVNYRVSLLIGWASLQSMRYVATYNPNHFNQFTTKREGETEEARKNRTNGRWLLSFWKALKHTQRTGGCLIQVGCALTRTVWGLLLEDPARGFTLACLLWPWQPLQTDHKDGPYSDMQTVERMMAERMGITVLTFEFEAAEVSEMKPDGEFVKQRDETAFKQRIEGFLFDHGICAEE